MTKRATAAAGVGALLLTLGMLLGTGSAVAAEGTDSVRITSTDPGTDNCIYREHILGC